MPYVFWAAFGGGAAAGVFILLAVVIAEWLRWFFDRPLVKVEMSLGLILGDATQTQYVYFEALNPHSKPVILAGIGLSFKGTKWPAVAILPPQLSALFPYQLDGGMTFNQRLTVQELIDALKNGDRVPGDITRVWFRSQAGKFFSRRIQTRVIKQIEQKYYEATGS